MLVIEKMKEILFAKGQKQFILEAEELENEEGNVKEEKQEKEEEERKQEKEEKEEELNGRVWGGEIGMSAYKRIRGKSKLQCQIESIEATQIDLRSKVR